MLLGDPIDTLLNLSTFAFIGAMIWLLRRPLPARPPGRAAAAPGGSGRDGQRDEAQ